MGNMKKCLKKVIPYPVAKRILLYKVKQDMGKKIKDMSLTEDNKAAKREFLKEYEKTFKKSGSFPEDYLLYHLYRYSSKERDRYVTYLRHRAISETLNQDESGSILDCKDLFNEYFKSVVKRDWLYMKNCSLTQFMDFIKVHPVFLVKPTKGYQGHGIYKEDTFGKGENQIRQLFDTLKSNESMVEELITQSGILHELNPGSVNTIRLCSFLIDGRVDVFQGILRVGNGEKCTDNFCDCGFAAALDMEHGIVSSAAIDKAGNTYLYHPVTKKRIIGIQIPYWDEVKEQVKKAALLLPKLQYISWDIVVSDNGQIEFIEGNTKGLENLPSHDGAWPVFKKYIKKAGYWEAYKKNQKQEVYNNLGYKG